MRTSELQGAALDWAVAKCEGASDDMLASYIDGLREADEGNYSNNWSQGGPIIERDGILLRALRRSGHAMDGQWLAMYDDNNTGSMVQWVKREDWPRHYLAGPTPLIAAMRCYVASKLGDEVEIPSELQ